LRRPGQVMEDPLYKLFVPDKDVKQGTVYTCTSCVSFCVCVYHQELTSSWYHYVCVCGGGGMGVDV
jgi:hypothetical protein